VTGDLQVALSVVRRSHESVSIESRVGTGKRVGEHFGKLATSLEAGQDRSQVHEVLMRLRGRLAKWSNGLLLLTY
jgi:hypothetical protein